jgi:hypothetical protein
MNSWAVLVTKAAMKIGKISMSNQYINTRHNSIKPELNINILWVCNSLSLMSTFTSREWVIASKDQAITKIVAEIRMAQAK